MSQWFLSVGDCVALNARLWVSVDHLAIFADVKWSQEAEPHILDPLLSNHEVSIRYKRNAFIDCIEGGRCLMYVRLMHSIHVDLQE